MDLIFVDDVSCSFCLNYNLVISNLSVKKVNDFNYISRTRCGSRSR